MNNVFARLDPNKFGKFGLGTWNSAAISRNLNPLQKSTNTNIQSYYKIEKLPPLPHIPSSPYNNAVLQPITNYKPLMTEVNRTQKSDTLYTRPRYNQTEYSNATVVPYPNSNNTVRPQLMDNYSSLTNRFFTPELIKMHILEEKIQRMEKTNKEDKENIRDILEGHQLAQKNGQPNAYSAMGIKGSDQEQREQRRMEVKKEIEEARSKLRIQFNDRECRGDDDDYDEDDSQTKTVTDSFESLKFKKRRGTIISQSSLAVPQNRASVMDPSVNRTGRRQSILLPGIVNVSPAKRSVIAPTVNTEKAKAEVEDFINLIPSHTAFQLQADSFKTRENLILLKSGLKEMRSDIQSKLEQIEIRQKLNLENIRYAMEKGGSLKLVTALRKYLDKENVDLDVPEEVPDYIRNLPEMIDEVINDKERKRKREEEAEKVRFEEERKRLEDEDMMRKAEEELMKKKELEAQVKPEPVIKLRTIKMMTKKKTMKKKGEEKDKAMEEPKKKKTKKKTKKKLEEEEPEVEAETKSKRKKTKSKSKNNTKIEEPPVEEDVLSEYNPDEPDPVAEPEPEPKRKSKKKKKKAEEENDNEAQEKPSKKKKNSKSKNEKADEEESLSKKKKSKSKSKAK